MTDTREKTFVILPAGSGALYEGLRSLWSETFGDAPEYIGQLRNADIGIELVRDEYLLIDFGQLHLFEGYGSEVLSPEEFYEKTGFAPEECDVPRVLAELSAEERKPYVVKTERSAVIADIRFVYFCADYVF